MGTWGTGAFDNDGAADWAFAFDDGATAAHVNRPIRRLAKRRHGAEIDLDDALEAVAAAEVIAAARGHGGRGVPKSVRHWIAETGYAPDEALSAAAAAVVDRVAAAGELRDEWGDDPRWSKAMADLARRLRAPAKAVRTGATARKRGASAASAVQPHRLTIRQIRDKLGYRLAANALDAEHNPTWLNAATTLKDTDLVFLGQITSLKKLVLAEGKFSPEGLGYLTNLNLVWLNLEATNIDDRAGSIIARIKTLERLDVQETRISDAFLDELKGLTRLTTLNVMRTKVTPRGVARLQKALRRCKIYWEPESSPPGVWFD